MRTLTEEYREVLKKTHGRKEKSWGNTSNTKYYDKIVKFIDENNATEVLDYGAGWGGLKDRLGREKPEVKVYEFEPARDEVAAPPAPCDYVICTDVFEHVEPEFIDNFFSELDRVTLKKGFFTVCMVPALKVLSDGRNAHLTVQPFDWWYAKVREKFHVELAHKDSKFADFYVRRKDA